MDPFENTIFYNNYIAYDCKRQTHLAKITETSALYKTVCCTLKHFDRLKMTKNLESINYNF
jgi:hypothetical protein